MKQHFDTLADLLNHGFDTVIDVRSEAEFAQDHIPGAINLPVLNNAERAQVGTIYKQQSPFAARRIGAAMVARNAATHIAGPLAKHPGSWRPLIYCWRGGQRSGSFATILSQVGWRTGLIEGGYQSWRRHTYHALYHGTLRARAIVLDGLTGTGKTDILSRLAQRGHQVIDLEALANHRGSILGARPAGQPSQKAFETALATAFTRLDPTRPVLLEAESNKIGNLHIPPALWTPMKTAPRIEITAPLSARAAYLSQTYANAAQDQTTLAKHLSNLRGLRGASAHDTWQEHLKNNDLQALAAALMQIHYDPSYEKSRSQHRRPTLGQAHTDQLSETGRNALTDQIETLLQTA